MSIIEAIKKRTSNAFITDRDVPENLIRQLLDVAVCTPVHYNTNPWRLLVMRGDARVRFGEFIAGRLGVDPAKASTLATKPLRAPVIIVVGTAKSDDPRALHIEDVASAAVACQNILLAAEELGLCAIWRTGGMTYAKDVVEFLGFEDGSELAGFIYLGYAKKDMPVKMRESAEDYTRWMD